MGFSNPPGEVSTLTVICTAGGGGGGLDAGGILTVESNDPAEFFQPDRLDSLRTDPVDRHPMLSKGLECVTHSLFQTKSYQLPSRGESVFTKTGSLNRRTTTNLKYFSTSKGSNSDNTDENFIKNNERQATQVDNAVMQVSSPNRRSSGAPFKGRRVYYFIVSPERLTYRAVLYDNITIF